MAFRARGLEPSCIVFLIGGQRRSPRHGRFTASAVGSANAMAAAFLRPSQATIQTHKSCGRKSVPGVDEDAEVRAVVQTRRALALVPGQSRSYACRWLSHRLRHSFKSSRSHGTPVETTLHPYARRRGCVAGGVGSPACVPRVTAAVQKDEGHRAESRLPSPAHFLRKHEAQRAGIPPDSAGDDQAHERREVDFINERAPERRPRHCWIPRP